MHRISIGAWSVSKKRTVYAGLDGVESLVFGHRGRPIAITGQLRAANVAALNVLIQAIENDMLDITGTLVDNWGASYLYCEFDSLTLGGPIVYSQSGSVYMQSYVLRGHQLRTV